MTLSNPKQEWQLFETLRLEKGSFFLLEEHIDRMMASARFFRIPVVERELEMVLQRYADASLQELERVRLSLNVSGEMAVEGFTMPLQQTGIQDAVLSPVPVDKSNICLYHKTTNRQLYNEMKNRYHRYFDVLFWNKEGQLTEFTIGNLVLKIDNILLTPPLDAGLLPGTFRSHLLREGILQERMLTKADLAGTNQAWLINSLRGWVEVRINANESGGLEGD